jgi:simple sugar transport system permease protein
MKQMTNKKFNSLFNIMRFSLAIIIAFSISLFIISFSCSDPFAAIASIFTGPFTSVRRFSTVIEMMIPLTFAGLAVCIMFKANMFNLAAEGSLFMGGLVAAICAIKIQASPVIVITISIFLGGLAGALVCAIPGWLKVKWGASEMVVSLMLNYVVLYLGTFIFNMTIKDPNTAYKASFKFPTGVSLPELIPHTNLHFGFIIMILFVVLVYIFMYKTKWGYKLRVTGSNIHFAKSAGLSVFSIIMMSQLLGGFVAGVGGVVEILGMFQRFQWSSLPGYGFDGVVINILARENPKYIPVAAFFVAFIRIGADYMYKQFGVASEIVAIIEGLIIILVAAEAFLAVWKHRMTTKVSKNNLEKEVA